MLERLFIKNYQKTNNTAVRNSYGKLAGLFGIITNLLLGILKVIVGFITNSISIFADAINNFSDTLASFLTIISFKLTGKRPDKIHPYGYARYEYIANFIIAIFMLLVGLFLVKESITKIIHPTSLKINYITISMLIIAIVVKIMQMLVYKRFANKIKSNTLKTASKDTRNDIITTSTILIAMIIMYFYKVNIDGYLGLIVSIFIIYSSIVLVNESLNPIIGIRPTKEQVQIIKDKLLSYNRVLGIHDLVIHNYGVNNDFVTVHVEVDSKLDLITAHDISDVIENDFRDEFGINLTIHIDPVLVGDKKVDKIQQLILENLHKLDKKISIHDLRISEGKEKIKIIFDCVIPFEDKYNEEYLINYLKENIPKSKKYYYYIEIDRPYC